MKSKQIEKKQQHELYGKTLSEAVAMGYDYTGYTSLERGYVSVSNRLLPDDKIRVLIGGRGNNKPYVERHCLKSTQYKVRQYLWQLHR